MIKPYRKYVKKSLILRQRAEDIYGWPGDKSPWEFQYLSSTLLSDVWQNWCGFCRDIVIMSCSGATTRSGTIINPRIADNSWSRVAYEAKQAIRGRSAAPTSILRHRRHEPTWGDQSILLNVIPVLAPSNATNLVSAFGLPVYAPKHIQTIRNACAHLNSETMADVRQLLPFYRGSNLSHPLDLLWWIEPNENADAIFTWFDELELVATQVTQ